MSHCELTEFLEKHQLSDCEIKIGQSVFKTNRVLLSSVSRVFERLFYANMSESRTGQVTIQEFSFDHFSDAFNFSLLDYFPSNSQISGENLEEFLSLADCYELEHLKKQCEEWIINNFSQLDEKQVFDLAQDYDLTKLKNHFFKKLLKKRVLGKHFDQQKFDLLLKDITILDLSKYRDMPTHYLELKTLVDQCSKLKTLNLRACEWVDQDVLSSVRNLSELEELDLSFSSIKNVAALSTLTKLKKLDLSYTDISDVTVVDQLRELEELQIDFCKIKEIKLTSQFKNLKNFSFGLCRGYMGDFTFLRQFPTLEVLKLSQTAKVNQNLDIVGELTHLHTLNLGNCELTTLAPLERLTNLKKLTLENNKRVSDISPLGKFCQLKVLCLKGCESVADFAALNSLVELDSLDILDCKLDRLDFLSRTNKMKQLRLSYVSDLSPLSHLKNLSVLKMSQPSNTPCDLTPLAELKELYLLELSDLNLYDISPLGSLTNLKELGLFNCKQLKEIGALKPLSTLSQLTLSNLGVIQDLSCLKSHTELRALHLPNCSGVQDFSFLDSLTKLEKLSLEGCQFTDAALLKRLQERCKLDIDETYVRDLKVLNSLAAGLQPKSSSY